MQIEATLRRLVAALKAAGANLTLILPDGQRIEIGEIPETTRVLFRTDRPMRAIATANPLGLAEAYLDGEVDVEGCFVEVMKVTDLLDMNPSRFARIAFWLRFHLPGRRRLHHAGISAHYDRPPEFFLAWLDRWRSYSHGFYTLPTDSLTDAQERKLRYAVEVLGLKAGMHVFDMGGGWGCFLEYAGRLGIHVHAITLSIEQKRFCDQLIVESKLPCTVELVDFHDYRPERRFDGAVFMGTFEHLPHYERVTGFLREHLKPEGRVYGDFCANRSDSMGGDFLRKYIWPWPATYVRVDRLVQQFAADGFNIHELRDDTLSYAYSVRDWALALEACEVELTAKFGSASVRAFLLLMWSSHWFFLQNRTQAYHIVAGRTAKPL